MDIVDKLSADHLAYWADQVAFVSPIIMKCPDGEPDCYDCQAIITADTPDGRQTVRVAWKPNEIDLANLAKGGTIWLSCWGGLPPHSLEVQPPE